MDSVKTVHLSEKSGNIGLSHAGCTCNIEPGGFGSLPIQRKYESVLLRKRSGEWADGQGADVSHARVELNARNLLNQASLHVLNIREPCGILRYRLDVGSELG